MGFKKNSFALLVVFSLAYFISGFIFIDRILNVKLIKKESISYELDK